MSVASPTRYTADDLLAMPDGKNYELVDGQLVELQMGMESSWVATRVARHLGNLVEDGGLGWVFGEGTGYQCFPHDPEQVRKPDASVLLKARLPKGFFKGYCRIPPDLVVEVVSPRDNAYDVNLRIDDWRSAGVPLVWVFWPITCTIAVYEHDRVHQLTGEDELTADPVIASFRCKVQDLFAVPQPTSLDPRP